MNEPWGHCTEWNKPDPKEQILYDFTYMSDLIYTVTFIKTESWIVDGRGVSVQWVMSFSFGSWQNSGDG